MPRLKHWQEIRCWPRIALRKAGARRTTRPFQTDAAALRQQRAVHAANRRSSGEANAIRRSPSDDLPEADRSPLHCDPAPVRNRFTAAAVRRTKPVPVPSIHKQSSSQKIAFMRSRRLLTNRNRWPLSESCRNSSRTIPNSPSKLFRMSTGFMHRNIFVREGRLSMTTPHAQADRSLSPREEVAESDRPR